MPESIYVQFSDNTQKKIVAYFSNAEPFGELPNVALVESDDPRYAEYHESLPQPFRVGMISPT